MPLPAGLLAQPGTTFVFLEDIIRRNVQALFPGTQVEGAHLFRVIRDTDMVIQEDEADDLLETVDRGLKQLRYGALSLLQVEADMPRRVLDILMENFEVDEDVVVRPTARMGCGDLSAVYALHRPALKDPIFHPRTLWAPDDADKVFEQIADQDFLVHHPFESFTSVETFLRAAVTDPHVVAIKMTLYRIGANSPLVDLLIEAAEQGKQVAVLVELKARFDERNNIAWATRLESAGIHVVYGLVNIKVHCKLCLVVRKETGGIRRYAHVATGNYNRGTSQVYTDLGLFTADPAHRRRRQRGVQHPDRLFEQALATMRCWWRRAGCAQGFRALIEREMEHAPAGRPARIIIKNNAVADLPIIRTLYKASQAGVPIDLIVRGVCCLRPGVPRHQRPDPRPLHRRPVPRALAALLLRERRRARGVHRQRRPDGAQPRPPGRGAGARSPIPSCGSTCATWCSRRCSPTPRGRGR